MLRPTSILRQIIVICERKDESQLSHSLPKVTSPVCERLVSKKGNAEWVCLYKSQVFFPSQRIKMVDRRPNMTTYHQLTRVPTGSGFLAEEGEWGRGLVL